MIQYPDCRLDAALKIQFADVHLRDLCTIQTDRGIITVIIRNEKTVFRFNDCRITIAVLRIAFQQSAFLRKGEIAAVTKRRTHINERKASVIADRQNERRSLQCRAFYLWVL